MRNELDTYAYVAVDDGAATRLSKLKARHEAHNIRATHQKSEPGTAINTRNRRRASKEQANRWAASEVLMRRHDSACDAFCTARNMMDLRAKNTSAK